MHPRRSRRPPVPNPRGTQPAAHAIVRGFALRLGKLKMRLDSKTLARLAGVLLLLLGTGAALAQDGKQPWEEYDKLINKRKAVTALGDDMFGDRVDLASGSVSFSQTDVSLTGNNALPVAVTRTFNVVSDKERPNYNFGDWDIDIPNISGLFAP